MSPNMSQKDNTDNQQQLIKRRKIYSSNRYSRQRISTLWNVGFFFLFVITFFVGLCLLIPSEKLPFVIPIVVTLFLLFIISVAFYTGNLSEANFVKLILQALKRNHTESKKSALSETPTKLDS